MCWLLPYRSYKIIWNLPRNVLWLCWQRTLVLPTRLLQGLLALLMNLKTFDLTFGTLDPTDKHGFSDPDTILRMLRSHKYVFSHCGGTPVLTSENVNEIFKVRREYVQDLVSNG